MIGISNDETTFSHKILLTDAQVSKICKAFINGSAANIKFSKTQSSRMIQSVGFLIDISNVTSTLDNIFKFSFKVMNSCSNEKSNINNKKITIIVIKIFL